MAKKFDIYLNNRLTQCDIIVYSIPYRDSLTATNQLILQSCLANYLLQKFVAIKTGSELVAHIDEMIKICNEKLSHGVSIGVDTQFSTYYSINPSDMPVVLNHDSIKMLAIAPIKAESTIKIAAEPLLAIVGKSLSLARSGLQIDQNLHKMIKNSIEQFSHGIGISVQVADTFKRSVVSADSEVALCANISDLCYRLHTSGETALQISASILGADIHHSLGRGQSGIVINTEMDSAMTLTKYEEISSAITILTDLSESVFQVMYPSANAVWFLAEAQTILRRYRLLSEMDKKTLLSFDDMTLDDLDYVILQE